MIDRYKTENTKLKEERYTFDDDGKRYSFKKDLQWKTTPIRFKTPQADLVRNKDFSFFDNRSVVSVATLSGRVKLTYSTRKDSRLLSPGWKIGGAKLIRQKGKWYLFVSMTKEVPDCSQKNIKEIVGIDRGLINIVTTRDSSNTFYADGSDVSRVRSKYDRTRASLQRKGTKGAKRVLKRLSGRENRWMENVNHSISKALVRGNTLFVIEDLSGISFEDDNLKNRTSDGRHELRSWAFYSFEQKLMYKAALAESMVVKVDPAYTSQRCPSCGSIGKSARHRDIHKYICSKCKAEFNDDEAAAYNLRKLGEEFLNGNENPSFRN